MITCTLRYTIVPELLAKFEEYARMWIPLVERFGGTHHGYFLPDEGANNVALAIFSFDSLARYEAYRLASADDPECRAACRLAEQSGCILSYERSFMRPVFRSDDRLPARSPQHTGAGPKIDPTAFVAPNAFVSGDVTIGPECRIMHGAQIIAEGGSISIGRNGIVLENAVLRSSARHSLLIGDDCLVGPGAHVVGCTVENEVFIATGAAVFHGARLGCGSEVRIHGVVHVRTYLAAGAIVPIGHVAVGDPAQVFPPNESGKIWAIQEPLDFPKTVYGIERPDASMEKITKSMSEALGGRAER